MEKQSPNFRGPLVSVKAGIHYYYVSALIFAVILLKGAIGSWLIFFTLAAVFLGVGFLMILFKGQGCDVYANRFIYRNLFGLRSVEIEFRYVRGLVILNDDSGFALVFHFKDQTKRKLVLPLSDDKFRAVVLAMKEIGIEISDPNRLVINRPSRSVEERKNRGRK